MKKIMPFLCLGLFVVNFIRGYQAADGAPMGFVFSMATAGFDYHTAPDDRKEDWIVKRAAAIAKTAPNFLPARDDRGVAFDLAAVRPQVYPGQVELVLTVDADRGMPNSPVDERAIRKSFCTLYLKTGLRKFALRLVATFKAPDGRHLEQISYGPELCDRYK